MGNLEPQVKRRFKMRRYMDDVIMVYAESDVWDSEKFIADFKESTCYHEPLTLQECKDNTFLETVYEIKDERFEFWLKNTNADGTQRTWRYHNYNSDANTVTKMSTLKACLRKVHAMASNAEVLHRSALAKIAEFRAIGYPTHLLRRTCAELAISAGDTAWYAVRQAIC